MRILIASASILLGAFLSLATLYAIANGFVWFEIASKENTPEAKEGLLTFLLRVFVLAALAFFLLRFGIKRFRKEAEKTGDTFLDKDV